MEILYILILVSLIGIYFFGKNLLRKDRPHYVYLLYLEEDNLLKVGETNNLYGRLTGEYGNRRYEGLLDNYNVKLSNSYFVKTSNKDLALKIESQILKSKDRTTFGNKSGKTEFLKNGLTNLHNILSIKIDNNWEKIKI